MRPDDYDDRDNPDDDLTDEDLEALDAADEDEYRRGGI